MLRNQKHPMSFQIMDYSYYVSLQPPESTYCIKLSYFVWCWCGLKFERILIAGSDSYLDKIKERNTYKICS